MAINSFQRSFEAENVSYTVKHGPLAKSATPVKLLGVLLIIGGSLATGLLFPSFSYTSLASLAGVPAGMALIAIASVKTTRTLVLGNSAQGLSTEQIRAALDALPADAPIMQDPANSIFKRMFEKDERITTLEIYGNDTPLDQESFNKIRNYVRPELLVLHNVNVAELRHIQIGQRRDLTTLPGALDQSGWYAEEGYDMPSGRWRGRGAKDAQQGDILYKPINRHFHDQNIWVGRFPAPAEH